ncbi:MAG: O-antigen ligase family protein [Planctomycetaceae bacterium]
MNVTQTKTKSVSAGSRAPLAILVALLSCEFFWPSLAAIRGDGLHLTFLWLVGLSFVSVWNHRLEPVGTPQSLGCDPANGSVGLRSFSDGLLKLGLALFLVGVWISTWHVFRVSGDRRAALNLAFAWTGIAACGCLCRITTHDPATRRTVVNLIAGLAVGLAMFGIWQSQVFYETEAKTYLRQIKVLETGTNPSEILRVRREFLSNGIPLDGPGRNLLENRLLNSTEPFGPFALANTLAGVLAVGLVLLSGGLISEWRSDHCRWDRVGLTLVATVIVAWCLMLTKSRTAWVGTAVGIAVMLVTQGREADPSRSIFRTLTGAFAAIGIPVGLLVVAGVLCGVVDLQVLLESSRSLQFRFFYWAGAAEVISEQPLFGAGPGNFRQLYLAHKPVQSSESIMDPHNFLLDAWCFAGVAGFIGMLLLVAGVIFSIRPATDTDADRGNTPGRRAAASLAFGLLGCVSLHFGWLWFSGVILGPQHAMTAAAIVLAGGSAWAMSRIRSHPSAAAAACLTLLVHLLGAGGLQVTTLWFLVVALAAIARPASRDDAGFSPRFPGRLTAFSGAVVLATAAAATLLWGVIPVVSSGLQLGIGQQQFQKGDNRGALHAFELAVSADPLSPTMRQHFAVAKTYSLLGRDWQKKMAAGGEAADEGVLAVESACSQYIKSDTRAIDSRLMRARIYRQLHRLTNQSGYIDSCIDDFRQVVAWHPTNARYQLELATCEETAGQTIEAMKSARIAKRIEAVNRAWGHTDQYLTADNLETMDRIISGGRQ